MPQQPLAEGEVALVVVVVFAVVVVVSVVVAVVVVSVVALLLAQQRADMVIRLALWRVWRLTSISMVRNKKLLPTFVRADLISAIFFSLLSSSFTYCFFLFFFAAVAAA